MPSLLPGFEYDIFISYRRKDNLSSGKQVGGEGWVAEFVTALKTELESTFKEDISVYYDENPHDGLLETHDVDESLARKLKCLIFIPILSQTYCDPKSFAWRHELVPFCAMAKSDGHGIKVDVSRGNVASRVLPVRIHDLDEEDKKLFESETSGFLRSIDFMFKSPGVSRPLRLNEDHPQDNLNKTYYGDQINKVALAIKDIIGGMKTPAKIVSTRQSQPAPASKRKYFSWKVAAALLVVVAIGLYFAFQNKTLAKDGKLSIAIIPFRNQTANQSFDGYSYGVASEIRTQLSLSKQFEFISSDQATIKFKDSKQSPSEMGEELGVDCLLLGSLYQMGDKLKITVELADGKNGKSIWSLPPYLTTLSSMEDMFALQTSIAKSVLEKFSLESNYSRAIPTADLVAYQYFLKGREYDQIDQLEKAGEFYEKAIQRDSNYLGAYVGLIFVKAGILWSNGDDTLSREKELSPYLTIVNRRFPNSWEKYLIEGKYHYHGLKDYAAGQGYFEKALAINANAEQALAMLSAINRRRLNLTKALEYRIRDIELNPASASNWNELSLILWDNGNNEMAVKAMMISKRLGMDDTSGIMFNQAFQGGGLDWLDEDTRKDLGPIVTIFGQLMQRDWNGMLRTVKTAPETPKLDNGARERITAMVYYLSGKQDTARILARDILKRGGPDMRGQDNMFAISGEREKAHAYFNATTAKLWTTQKGQDGSRACTRTILLIQLMMLTGEYKEATDLLVDMNKRYPEFGNYGEYRNDPLYDRIKAEYPPFVEVLKNLKLPPKLDVTDIMKKYAKTPV